MPICGGLHLIMAHDLPKAWGTGTLAYVIQFAPKTVQKLLLPGILSSPLSHRIPAKSMI
jgi:hypothetical protein